MSESNSIGDQIEGKLKGAVVNALMSILVAMIRPLATLTEVFFRKEMGERYFAAWNAVAGLFLVSLAGAPMFVERGQWRIILAAILGFLWIGSLFFYFCLHYNAMVARYRNGGRWHSFNSGLPRYEPLDYRVEKAIPFAVGVLLLLAGLHGLGLLMFLSGGVSLYLRHYEATKFRERMLDMIDGQIEHDNLSKAVKDRLSPSQTEGFQAPLPAYVSDEFREKFIQTIIKVQ